MLRRLQVGRSGQCRGSGVHASVSRRSLRGIAKRRLRYQATRVNRPERNARANGRVDSGLQLSFIIHAIQSQAAGEVDERLLLVQLPQHPGGRLQRGKLAVRIEDVELAVVLAEGSTGISTAGVIDGFSRALTFTQH